MKSFLGFGAYHAWADGMGFFFLSLSPIQRMDKGGRNWLPMPWNRAGDIRREVHDVDRHACQEVAFFIFQSEAEQDRTHTQWT